MERKRVNFTVPVKERERYRVSVASDAVESSGKNFSTDCQEISLLSFFGNTFKPLLNPPGKGKQQTPQQT